MDAEVATLTVAGRGERPDNADAQQRWAAPAHHGRDVAGNSLFPATTLLGRAG